MAVKFREPDRVRPDLGGLKASGIVDRSVDASIKCLTLLHQAVGERCFAWGIAADDSGTQQGEFINPRLWAEMIKPHYKKLCDWIHRNTRWKTFLHCCGSIYHLIPHFIDAGVDILNPVQTSAANMEPARLKKEFGGKIVFWGGGCDTQSVLERLQREFASTSRSGWPCSLLAAATYLTKCTTFSPMCRQRM